MDSRQFEYYARIVHPFLAIYIPFAFLYLFVLMITGTLLDSYIRFPAAFPLVMLIAAFSEVLVGNLLYRERVAGLGPRIREYVFVLAVCVGLSYLLLKLEIRGGRQLNLNLNLVLCGIVATLQWIFTLFIHHNLQYRLFFLKPFRDKPVEQYRQVYQEFGHEAAESLQAVAKVIRINSVFTVFTFAGTVLAAWLLQVRFSALQIVLLSGYFVFGFFIRALLNSYLEEQQLYMEGLQPDRGQKKSRTVMMAIFVAALSVAGIVSTGQEAPVPASVLVDFYHWLSALMESADEPVRRERKPVIPQSRPQETPYRGQIQALGDLEDTGVDLSWLTKAVGYTILGALVVGIVLFILRPLIRSRESLYFLRSLARSLREVTGNLRYMGTRFLEFFRRNEGGNEDRGERLKPDRPERNEQKPHRQPRGLTEILFGNRLLRAFMRFTKWGTKQGVTFELSIAPMEYAEMLADRFPTTTPDVTKVAVLFERSEFSPVGIDENERDEYLRTVKTIVKTKPSVRG
jgi:hypothetical protein